MKAVKLFLLTHFIFLCHLALAQVKTNFNNETLITIQGRFAKNYNPQIDFELPSKNINELLEKGKNEMAKSSETNNYRIKIQGVLLRHLPNVFIQYGLRNKISAHIFNEPQSSTMLPDL